MCISVHLTSYSKTLVARLLLPMENRSFLLLVLQAAEPKIKTQAGSVFEEVGYLLTHSWVYFMWKGQEVFVVFFSFYI